MKKNNNIIHVKAVMIFIFDDDNNMLLLKRIDNDWREAVKWWFIGNENYIEAGNREIFEETWLILEDGINLFTIVEDSLIKDDWIKLLIDWHVAYGFTKWIKPVIDIDHNVDNEHYEYRWEHVSNILWIDLFPKSANTFIKGIIKKLF